MIVTAVVCPPAPLLVPGLADRLAAAVAEMRTACERAVGALRAVEQVLILSVGHPGTGAGSAASSREFGPGSVVTAAGLARSDRALVAPVRLPGGRPVSDPVDGTVDHGADLQAVPASVHVAVGTAIAAELLTRAGITVPTTAVELGTTALPILPPCRVGLLVMADGAPCHGEHSPGGPDPAAVDFDLSLVAALRSGDPELLARTCAELAVPAVTLRAGSLPALAAMAELTADAGTATATVLHYSAPFGVGYPVAVWQWA